VAQVGIVCDSTCDLTPEWLAAHDVRMVPLRVLFGEETHLDWVDMYPEEFFKRLATAQKLPTTSQPSPADFERAYAEIAAAGCSEIVSVHLTAALSGTFESATLAAKTSVVPVHVIDTKTCTQALGLIVKRAVSLRDSGASAEEIARACAETAAATRLYFVLDTLDYLVKGGRAGKSQGLAASLLNIKPILVFNAEGTIEPFKKVKGMRKAMSELADHVAEESRAKGRLRVAFLHSIAPDLADELRAALDTAGADYESDSIGEVGAVIGTYAGPRAVGVGYYPIT
jgi:DegV family protein with EDD domain